MGFYTINDPDKQLERDPRSPTFAYLHKTDVRLYIYATYQQYCFV